MILVRFSGNLYDLVTIERLENATAMRFLEQFSVWRR